MKKITIKRNSSLINLNVSYAIIIDDEEIAKIKNGQNLEIKVPDNSNHIQFGFKHFKSNKIPTSTLKNNGIIKIKSNNLAFWGLLVLLLYTVIQSLIIFNLIEFNYNFLLLLIGFSIIVYVQMFKSDHFIEFIIKN